jgi:hypothetical protein
VNAGAPGSPSGHHQQRYSQVFSKGGYQWERGRHKKRENESEYSGYILYLCKKIKE